MKKIKRYMAGLLAVALMVSMFSYITVYAADAKTTALFPDSTEDEVLQAAKSGLGVPYVWGGTTTDGWDCSGYVTWVARKLGVDMGRTSSDIADYCEKAKATVASGDSDEQFNRDFRSGLIRPGDILVFFNSSGDTVHAAIIGRNQTIYHAWNERVGTINNRFDEVWGVNGGHGKVYTTYTVYRGVEDKGKAKIQKSSGNVAVTGENDCYSLSGATYTVYSDKSCTKSVATLTTNAKGNTGAVELAAGTYYVKETTAPKGYKLDKNVHALTVKSGKTATLKVSDIPKADTVLVEITKIDMESEKSVPQGTASLEGAEFVWKHYDGYYTKNNLPERADRTWTTRTITEKGSDGTTRYITGLSNACRVSGDSFYMLNDQVCLPLGTLTIEEKKAPEGYLLEGAYMREKESGKTHTGLYVAQITEDGELAVLQSGNRFSVSDKIIRGGVKIQKRDLETKETKTQGSATLKDTAFTITSLNKNPVLVDGTLYTDGQVVKTIRTVDGGTATTAADTLPYGHYRLDEATAPKGYLREGAVSREFDIVNDGQIVDLTDESKSVCNQVIRGGVKIQKRDLETKETKPQGGATFKDTVFTITSLNENTVLVNGEPYSKNETVATIRTDTDGVASTSSDALPYGTYRIEENKAPEGYLTEGAKPVAFSIAENGKIVDLTDEAHFVCNQIKRGDIEGVKIGSGTHKRLMNVPFEITSKTTGESHVIVTDKNGQFSTSSDWVSHKQNTNAGSTSEDGVWFGTSEPDDSKGALLYDTYTVRELRCDSNRGMTLIPSFDVVVSRDKVIIDLGTLTDEYEPEISIHTSASDKATDEKSIVAGKSVTVVDTVALDGLKKGAKYQLKGWQMMKSENTPLLVDGKPVENDYSFTAGNSKMEIDIPYTFDASALGGKELVTFEELYELSESDEPVKVAEHKDIEDDGQTVEIKEREIQMRTSASDRDTGERRIVAGKEVTVVDTVTLDGLEKGVKYQLKGWEMVKSENARLLVGGKPVESDHAFIAEDSKMEIQIAFSFDARELAGKELVAFEELYDVTNPEKPVKVAEHKDLEDEGQTVVITKRVITMRTTATEKDTGRKTVEADKKVTIVDTVILDGLEEGVKYRLKGWEMVKSKNTMLLINGKSVKSHHAFTAEASRMEVQITFSFDARELAGKELVTFEELYDVTNPEKPVKVAEHKDIRDSGQTVTVREKPETPSAPKTEKPDTPGKAKTPPQTGDNMSVAALLSVMGISAAALLLMAYRKIRSRKERD